MSLNKNNLIWYEKYAQPYFEHIQIPENSIYHAFYEKPAMYSLLPKLKGKKIITLGCGSGEENKRLKDFGAKKSVGIDISKKLVSIASWNNPECFFKRMNAENIKFPEKSFDLAYSSLMMHYIKDWEKVLRGVFRILKPKSFFIFSCGHPISTAMNIKHNAKEEIKKIQIYKDKIGGNIKIEGDYFKKRKIKDFLLEEKNGFVYVWHRTLTEMILEINKSGFVIKEILEPLPIKTMNNVSPSAYKRLRKIPKFIIFKLMKP